MIKNIIRQSEPYEFLIASEIEEMREEGYKDFIIADSIDELIYALKEVKCRYNLE